MATYYIDGAGGSEANDGLSEAAPKRYLSADIGIADGDIVKLKRGTTVELTANLYPQGDYVVEDYGDATLPIPVLAIPGGIFQLTHTGTTAGKIYQMQNLRGVNIGNIGEGSFFSCTERATCIVLNLEIHSPFQNGVRLGYGNNHQVRYCNISQIRNNGIITGKAATAHGSYGLYEYNKIDASFAANDALTLHDGSLGGAGIHNIIRYNKLIAGAENCIDLVSCVSLSVVHDNILSMSASTEETWAAIVASRPATIFKNIIFGGPSVAINIKDSGSASQIYSNIIVCGEAIANAQAIYLNNVTSCVVTNNTIISNSKSTRPVFRLNSGSSHTIKNNFIRYFGGDSSGNTLYSLTTYTPSSGEIDYNYYEMIDTTASKFNSTAFATWQAAYTIETDSTVADLFTGKVSPVFTITATSPLYANGVFIKQSLDYSGKLFQNPPSIGAYESFSERAVR